MTPPTPDPDRPVLDMAGNPILPGCLLLYPAKTGSTPELFWGKVIRTSSKFVPSEERSWQRGSGYVERVVLQGLYWNYAEEGRVDWKLKSKFSVLQYPNRTFVVPWENVIPAYVRGLLQNFEI